MLRAEVINGVTTRADAASRPVTSLLHIALSLLVRTNAGLSVEDSLRWRSVHRTLRSHGSFSQR